MKRLLLANCLSVLVVPVALATTNYINTGTVNVISPPQIAPQIDASNFVNYGFFYITNIYPNNVQPPLPYETWNTRTWTNANWMAGDSGFRFDYYDSVGQTNGWSASFQNAGTANPTNADIFGASYVLVAATNIINNGTMAVGGPGLMTLNGRNIDLTRGTLGAVGNETNDLAGVLDVYWGVDSDPLSANFAPFDVSSSFTLVTTIQNNQYVQMGQDLHLNNSFYSYLSIRTNFFGANVQTVDALFLRQTNPAITVEVRFNTNDYGPGVEKTVQWQALLTNRVSGAVSTNQVYLDDRFAYWFIAPGLAQTLKPNIYYTLFAGATYHPENYSITHAAPFGYAADAIMTSVTNFDPTIFNGFTIPPPTFVTNAGYAATLTAAAFNPDPTIQGSTYTNVPGRIEITAAGANSCLNLERAQINGQSYLLLNSTNHFVGSTNAVIVSPISDIYLGSTNGMMVISNLTTPFVPRMVGEIQVWSGRWTNIVVIGTNAVATYYNVTVVDSDLAPQAPSQIQNLSLRSPNLLIGDTLNVFGSLLLNTTNLTITTNALHAPTPCGELNLASGNLVWSPSLPVLQNLTNFGIISSVNSIYFAGARMPPWFSGTFDEPYLNFVTHGFISSVGCSIWATNVEASGTNETGIGPLTLQANTATITNGAFLATDADITLTCGSLLMSNQVLQAGRSITLTVTNSLDDGSLTNSVGTISEENTWNVGNGFNLLLRPAAASLLATTVTNLAQPGALVVNQWAGADLGRSTTGYVSNAALGRLFLDGGSDSLFSFMRTGPTNALYVDYLEFQDYATNRDNNGNYIGINLDTNFTLYYAQAVANGVSVAEKLNGKYGIAGTNGGRFSWISSYAGYYSSTTVTNPDGTTYQANAALRFSPDIDSNDNGIANAFDPMPFLIPSQLGLAATVTNLPQREVVLSWNTLPYATNFVYFKPSVMATNWQLLTNPFLTNPFVYRSSVAGRAVAVDPLGAGSRYYRVSVEAAQP